MKTIGEEWKILVDARDSAPVKVNDIPLKLGIDLRFAYLGAHISGMLEKMGSSYRITVNAGDPHTRKRFTLAHELGHYMLHRHLIDEGIDDDRAYRSTDKGKYHNTQIGPSEETKANKFAANLLMPRDLINLEMDKLSGNKNDKIRAMAKKFEVSEQSMAIRLGWTLGNES